MQVVKRNNKHEDVSFDKILTRLKTLGKDNNININYSALCLKVIDQLYDKIETTKIDELAAQQCASMITVHYDYGTLAGLISTPMIRSAPTICAPWITLRPIPPNPKTATVLPGSTLASKATAPTPVVTPQPM